MRKHKVDIKEETIEAMENLGYEVFNEEFLNIDLIFRHTQKHTKFVGVEIKSGLTRQSVYATISECLYHLTEPLLFSNYGSVEKIFLVCPIGSVENRAREVLEKITRTFNLPIEFLQVERSG